MMILFRKPRDDRLPSANSLSFLNPALYGALRGPEVGMSGQPAVEVVPAVGLLKTRSPDCNSQAICCSPTGERS